MHFLNFLGYIGQFFREEKCDGENEGRQLDGTRKRVRMKEIGFSKWRERRVIKSKSKSKIIFY